MYAAEQSDDWKRRRKQQLLTELKDRFERTSKNWEGMAGLRRWFKGPLNNAKLLSIATYYDHVPAMQALLAQHDGDLRRFYAAVRRLADLGSAQRNARLAELRPAN